MISSIILIEGEAVQEQSLRISLSNAKQLVIGKAPGFGFLLHVAANGAEDLSTALTEFSKVEAVTGVINLGIRSSR